MTYIEPGETIISGPIVDQAALHGLLARIRDLNLTLLSVNKMDPKDIVKGRMRWIKRKMKFQKMGSATLRRDPPEISRQVVDL